MINESRGLGSRTRADGPLAVYTCTKSVSGKNKKKTVKVDHEIITQTLSLFLSALPTRDRKSSPCLMKKILGAPSVPSAVI
jgi:hypothetical protein